MPLLWAVLAACDAVDAPCPTGSMAEGPGGLLVTDEEHPTGFGRATCFDCHALDTLHDAGCTTWVDPTALREEVDAAVQTQGEAACTTCHGENGVTP